MHKYQNIADTYTGENCLLYTLDDIKEAQVCGRQNQFATIMAREGALKIEVNWPLVERKMQGDKTFYTC